MSAQLASLPRIVRFRGTVEGDTCPHCGASGRWIALFTTEDGRELGAMSGCVKLFPVSPIAREEQRLRKKAEDYAKRGWGLNMRDHAALAAIEEFFEGRTSEREALGLVRSAKAANSARYRGRR